MERTDDTHKDEWECLTLLLRQSYTICDSSKRLFQHEKLQGSILELQDLVIQPNIKSSQVMLTSESTWLVVLIRTLKTQQIGFNNPPSLYLVSVGPLPLLCLQ